MLRPPPRFTLFPYPTLFRSSRGGRHRRAARSGLDDPVRVIPAVQIGTALHEVRAGHGSLGRIGGRECPLPRSEEHTSELQSLAYLECRLLLETKKVLLLLRA